MYSLRTSTHSQTVQCLMDHNGYYSEEIGTQKEISHHHRFLIEICNVRNSPYINYVFPAQFPSFQLLFSLAQNPKPVLPVPASIFRVAMVRR